VRTGRFLFWFTQIQLLAWVQRAARLILRFVWLAAGLHLAIFYLGILLERWDILPTLQEVVTRVSFEWIIMLILGLFTFWSLFLPWPRFTKIAWKLDRGLKYREQISAAWEVIRNRKLWKTNQIAVHLVEDSGRLLPRAWLRVFTLGWRLGWDLISVVIILLLYVIHYSQPVENHFPYLNLTLLASQRQALPAFVQDPSAKQLFPSGVPGLRSALAEENQENLTEITAQNVENPAEIISKNNLSAGMELLDQLAKQLEGNVLTSELSEALHQQNLEASAQALEELSTMLDALSEETLSELSQTLQKSGEELTKSDFTPFGNYLQQAGQFMEDNKLSNASEQLQSAANSLRDLEGKLAKQVNDSDNMVETASKRGASGGAGLGSSKGEVGSPQPLERFGEQGQEIALEQDNQQPSIIAPGNGDQPAGEPVLGGQTGGLLKQTSQETSSYIFPYDYPWLWSDVIAEYFKR
jgi:hypothetical protein